MKALYRLHAHDGSIIINCADLVTVLRTVTDEHHINLDDGFACHSDSEYIVAFPTATGEHLYISACN